MLHVYVQLETTATGCIEEGHLDSAKLFRVQLDADPAIAGQAEQVRLVRDLGSDLSWMDIRWN
jgi:hypothetical protein